MDQEEPQNQIKKPVFDFPASFKKRLWWYFVLVVVAFDWMAWLEIKSGQYQNYPEYAILVFSSVIFVVLGYSYLAKKTGVFKLCPVRAYLVSLSMLAILGITLVSWLVRSGLV